MPAWTNRSQGRVFADLHHDIVNNMIRIEVRIPGETLMKTDRGEIIALVHETIDKLFKESPV